MNKKTKLELTVSEEIKARLTEDTRGGGACPYALSAPLTRFRTRTVLTIVTNWTTHVSSTKGRSVTLTLRPPCPKIAVM